MPESTTSSFSTNYTDRENMYMTQHGTSKYKGNGQYGSGEFSYEIDTLNLINVGFNRYAGTQKNTGGMFAEMRDIERMVQYSYFNKVLDSKGEHGGTNINVDYQRTFSGVPDRLLTTSYLFSHSPNNSKNNNLIKAEEGILPAFIDEGQINQWTDATTKEHTFQVDYTTPVKKIHTIEAGVKYIIRINESNSAYDILRPGSNTWEPYTPFGGNNDYNQFEHRNDIFAAYGGYSLKFKKWGIKAGLRYEYTDLSAEYPLDNNLNFGTDYSNFIPSFTATYKIDDTQNVRAGYNMRISRPGIWQLNPYENTSDPNYISAGNPDLDAVKSHSLNINYGYFNPKININLNVSYEFENDAIERYTYIKLRDMNDPESTTFYTTYQNIGKRKRWNASGYFNWNAHAKFRLHANFFGSYVDLKANNGTGLANSGYTGRVFAGAQYNLPWNVWIHGYYGVGAPWIGLTEKGTSFTYHTIQLRKSFKEDRLNVRLYAANPFTKTLDFKYSSESDQLYRESLSTQKRREVGFSLSFRFGEMKTQIKKTARGISNDDTMGGGQEGGQGGGQQGGGQ